MFFILTWGMWRTVSYVSHFAQLNRSKTPRCATWPFPDSAVRASWALFLSAARTRGQDAQTSRNWVLRTPLATLRTEQMFVTRHVATERRHAFRKIKKTSSTTLEDTRTHETATRSTSVYRLIRWIFRTAPGGLSCPKKYGGRRSPVAPTWKCARARWCRRRRCRGGWHALRYSGRSGPQGAGNGRALRALDVGGRSVRETQRSLSSPCDARRSRQGAEMWESSLAKCSPATPPLAAWPSSSTTYQTTGLRR